MNYQSCYLAMLQASHLRYLGFDIESCHAINGEPRIKARPSKNMDPLVKIGIQYSNANLRAEIDWTPRKH